MEPRIQYAKTADGVSIAFLTLGEGIPLVIMPPGIFSHIQLEWQHAATRRWYEALASGRRLVRYDGRGGGLSQREITSFSIESFHADLAAVIDDLDLERVALWGWGDAGPAAISFTAHNPDRVSHLLLWCTYAATSDPPWLDAMDHLMAKDWEAYTETVAHAFLGWSNAEDAHWLAALIREAVDRASAFAATAAGNEFDTADLLSEVRSPTLVLQRRGLRWPSLDMARYLSANIANARLALLEGDSPLPQLGDTTSVLEAVTDFLGDAHRAPAVSRTAPASALVTILYTDLVGHTEMMSRLGDERGRAVLREHERITREVLKAHGGTEVKTMGDGFMASFGSVARAVECAIALQRAFAEWNASHSAHPERARGAVEGAAVTRPSTGSERAEELRIRIGLNAGEPIEEEGDLFGAAVILAARIAARAEGGEILASLAVRELCAGKGFLFADTGEVALKGFEEPVRLFAVRWRKEG